MLEMNVELCAAHGAPVSAGTQTTGESNKIPWGVLAQ